MPICWRRSSCAVALWLKVCGWLGVTTGHHGQVSPPGASLPLLHCGGIVPSCSHPGCFPHVPVLAPACRGVMWWPQAGTGRAHDREHQETKHGWMLPELCPGLSKLCWFKCHSSKRPHSHCGCRQRCCPVTSTRQGVPGSGIIPEMGSMQGVHALTGLIRPVKAPPANRGQGETRWQKV